MQIDENDEITAPVIARTEFPYGIFGVLSTVIILMLFFLAGTAVQRLTGISLDDANIILLQAVMQIAGILVPALLLMRRAPIGIAGLMRAGTMQWKLRDAGSVLLAVVLTLACESAVNDMQLYLLPQDMLAWMTRMSAQHDVSMKALLRIENMWSLPLQFLALAVIPAVTEETLFRGLFQKSLEQVRSALFAIICSALLFSLVHFQPTTFLPMIVLSVVLGVLARATQSLVPGMLLHAVFNLLMLVSYHAGVADLNSMTPVMSLPQSALLFIASASALVYVLKSMVKR